LFTQVFIACKLHGSFDMSWGFALAPLILVQCTFLYQLTHLVVMAFRRTCFLSRFKKSCIFLYFLSTSLCLIAEADTVLYQDMHRPDLLVVAHEATGAMWIAAATIFVLCGTAVMRQECLDSVARRCFSSPLPLAHTPDGWISMPRRRVLYPLVGSVEMAPSFLKDPTQYGSPLPPL
jgi:hypothetical protein